MSRSFCTEAPRAGRGRGNVIEPLKDAPEKYLLVIKPNASISDCKSVQSAGSGSLDILRLETYSF